MVLIPAGSFRMGNDFPDVSGEEAATTPDQRPGHTVQIGAFYMDKYEVSRALWDSVAVWAKTNGYDLDAIAVMHSNYSARGSVPINPKPQDHPAVFLNWTDFVKWCNARSEMEGRLPAYKTNGVAYRTGVQLLPQCDFSGGGYRLPTEAEWEKAARGGLVGTRFPWGDTISHVDANYYVALKYVSVFTNNFTQMFLNGNAYRFDVSPTGKGHPVYSSFTWQWGNAAKTNGVDVPVPGNQAPETAPVGAFSANGYGLHNMAGNVAEACWDLFDENYYRTLVASRPDPRGPPKLPAGMFPDAHYRVLRGGSFYDNYAAAQCQVSFRTGLYQHPGFTGNAAVGFRTVVVAEQDSDGDGLRDDWENQGKGIDANGDGKIDLDLFALGARPDRKDLFVEVDAEPFLQAEWNRATQWPPFQLVINSFANAPVSNPDGSKGISLHILRSDATIPNQTGVVQRGDLPPELVSTKASFLGSAAQRSDPNATNIIAAVAMAFRYCTIYEDLNFKPGQGSYIGLAEFSGDDFVLQFSDKRFRDGKNDSEEIAGAFMHELGHTLGLYHGGSDRIQGKPNYPSVMNYALVAPLPFSKNFWKLDYSREGGVAQGGTIPVVGEDFNSPGNPGADEASGISSRRYRNFRMPIGVPVGSTDPSVTNRVLTTVKLDGSPADFNGDGQIDPVPTRADVNFIGPGCGFAGVKDPSLGELHEPHKDWDSLLYSVNPMNTNTSGYEIDEGCPTPEVLDFLEANVPETPFEKTPQTVVFEQPGMQIFLPGAQFALSASSDCDLPVQFLSSNTNVVTISNNVATIVGAGAVAITATNAGDVNFLPGGETRSVTVFKASQLIAGFNPIEAQIFAPGRTVVIALPLASSGLPVSVAVKSGPATITNNIVTLSGTGTVTLAANQAGNVNYQPAPEVTASFVVTSPLPSPTPTPTPAPSPTPSPTPTPTPNPTPGVLWDEDVDGPLSDKKESPTPLSPAPESNFILATVGGGAAEDYFTFTIPQGRTLASVMLTAYESAESAASIGLQLGSAWTAADNPNLMLAQQQFGADNVTGDSMLLGISPGNPLGAGTYTVRVKQTGAATLYNLSLYVDSPPLPKPVVTSPGAASGTVGTAFTYRITADNMPVSFGGGGFPLGLTLDAKTGIISGIPKAAGNFSLFVTAINAQGTGFAPVLLSIVRAAQSIRPFAVTNNVPFGTVLTFTNTNSNAGLPVSFERVSGPVVVTNNRATVTGVGAVVVRAVQAGNTNFNAAVPVTNAFTTVKAGQSIRPFAVTNNVPFGTVLALTNTRSSAGLPVSFERVSGPVVVANNRATVTGVGAVVVRAVQAGNTNFHAAVPVTNAFTTVKAGQSITFTNLPDVATFRGNARIPLDATSSSGLPVSYVSANTNILRIVGTNAVMRGPGTNSITARQPGNTNYRAASNVVRVIVIK